jgi:hypothetical protein
MDSQKKVWLTTWAALLNSGVGLPPFHAFNITCTPGRCQR